MPNPAPNRMTARDGGTQDGITWCTVDAPIPPAVNGYALIPDGHPWHGLDYDAIDVEVHGGLTFANGDWIGFDTMHGGDVWPGSSIHTPSGYGWDKHWTPELVVAEARSLASKVAAAQLRADREANYRFANTPQAVTA